MSHSPAGRAPPLSRLYGLRSTVLGEVVRVNPGILPLYRAERAVGAAAGFAGYVGGGHAPAGQPQIPRIRPEDVGENPERWAILKGLAFMDVAAVLREDKRCREFLGISQKQISGLVNALFDNSKYANISAVARTSGRGRSAKIYLGRSFFSDTAYKYSLQGPSPYGPDDPMQWRALTLLHESAHALNRLPDDRDSEDQSIKNDRTVYEECKQGIDSLYRLGAYGNRIPPPR